MRNFINNLGKQQLWQIKVSCFFVCQIFSRAQTMNIIHSWAIDDYSYHIRIFFACRGLLHVRKIRQNLWIW